MSHNNNDESFDLLPHEKKISEIYHSNNKHQAELPSAQIDARIMAMAKEQSCKQSLANNKSTKNKRNKTWQWPVSLAASIGILGVLFITQTEYFIQPNNINSNDAGILHAPIMSASDINFDKIAAEQTESEQNVQVAQMAAIAAKSEMFKGKKTIAQTRNNNSVSESSFMFNEQISDSLMLEDKSINTTPMSLADMAKLAEQLKLALTNQHSMNLPENASSIKLQKTLFDNLIHYQKNHRKFTITEKYLSVLTEQQVQQLTALSIEAVPE